MPANTVTDLFNTQAHNPSFRRICASLESSTDLVDFCVPVNCYFPPAELLEEIRHALPEIVKYYPDYVETHQTALSKLAQEYCRRQRLNRADYLTVPECPQATNNLNTHFWSVDGSA